MNPSQTFPRALPWAVRMMKRPTHVLTQTPMALIRPKAGALTSARHFSLNSKEQPNNLEKEIFSLNNDLKFETQSSEQLKHGLESKVQTLIKELSQARETEKRLADLAKQTEKYADWARRLRQWENDAMEPHSGEKEMRDYLWDCERRLIGREEAVEARLRMLQRKGRAGLLARFRTTKIAERLRWFVMSFAVFKALLVIYALFWLVPGALEMWLGYDSVWPKRAQLFSAIGCGCVIVVSLLGLAVL